MKIFFKILCYINLLGMFVGLVSESMIAVVYNGFCGIIMFMLSNDSWED